GGYQRESWPAATVQPFNELPSRVPGRFLIENSYRALVGDLRVLMGVANRGQPCSSKLAQGAHHVKNHARLARLIEVQIVPHHDVEKIVWSQCAIRGRLDMIAGNKELLLPIGRGENRRFRVVSAVRKKLQS